MAEFWTRTGMLCARGLTPGSIEDSIAKWECLFNLCVAGELVRDGGSSTCSLCRRYGAKGSCNFCPIQIAGFPNCYDTAYEDYYEAVKRGDLPAATSAAEEMVEFLEKLLSEGL